MSRSKPTRFLTPLGDLSKPALSKSLDEDIIAADEINSYGWIDPEFDGLDNGLEIPKSIRGVY